MVTPAGSFADTELRSKRTRNRWLAFGRNWPWADPRSGHLIL